MKEFCLECLNKISGTEYTEREFILSQNLTLCDECKEMRHVVVTERRLPLLYDVKQIIKRFKRRK